MKVVYVIVYKGEIKFVTCDDEYADDFCCEKNEPMVDEAMLELGYDLNDEDKEHWKRAYKYAKDNGELYWYEEIKFDSKDNLKKDILLDMGTPTVVTNLKEILSFLQ